MNTIVLQTEDLKKHFSRGDVKAVDGVNLSVQRGEVFGFLGPNGAGKTTTIGMILGLLHATSGSVTVLGQPVTPAHTTPLRAVGALVGAPALFPYLSARDNLGLIAKLDGPAAEERITSTLALVGLTEAADRKAGKYSTGMKQRLGLGLALVRAPQLLVLDEPSNGMDPGGMRDLRDLLRKLADQGMTVFLSSHLLHEVEQLCDRVAVLNRGKIVAQGPVQTLLNDQKVVRVRVASPAEAATLLLTLPGVTKVQPNGTTVTVSGPSSDAIVAHLVAHGIIPSEVTQGQEDLENLFLQLTQPAAA
ncbi:MAG: ABC transporter ATP-binding protein [Anaerolineae bacterium]